MNRLIVPVMALCAAIVCGCTPEAVPTAPVESLKSVCVCADGRVSIYGIGAKQHTLLREEFEAWKQAGFEGFDESFVKRPPAMLLIGKTEAGVSYKIDLREERVIVYEEKGTMVDGTRYAREATAADKRLRLFLCACIADGTLPKTWGGKMPSAKE